jgi:sortase A
MKIVGNVFAALGVLALGYWAWELVSARIYQAQQTRIFTSKLPSAAALYPSTGSTVALLTIPRLGLESIVVEGAEERELKLGPGHIPGTSLPGGGGNVGMAGHRDTFFRPLRLIRKDDAIKVITHQQEYRYKVVSTKIVAPEDVQVLYPAGHETLTLVTCYPFDFVGAAPKRFIVRADCTNCLP